jgi:hypothetical protein
MISSFKYEEKPWRRGVRSAGLAHLSVMDVNAANLKFLSVLPQVCYGNFKSNPLSSGSGHPER